jgi:hypothetical protein
MFYDVPVKLFSFHLLLMAVFLAAPDLPRLANLLVFNRAAPAASAAPLSERNWICRGAPILVSVLGAAVLCGLFLWAWRGYVKHAAAASVKPPYYGVWEVDDFAAGGPAGHAVFTDKLREEMRLQPGDKQWKSLIFERSKVLVIQCGTMLWIMSLSNWMRAGRQRR